jgi:signal peptidase I
MFQNSLWRDYLENILIAVLLATFIRTFVWTAYRVPSDSMAPTLVPGDFIFAFKLPFDANFSWLSEVSGGPRVNKGEVVVFSFPDSPRVSFVRRVIGLPGDFITVQSGKLYVNEKLTGIWAGEAHDFHPVVVPPGQIFVGQDNFEKGSSSDEAHKWGLVSSRLVEGRVQLIWLSLDWTQSWLDGLMPKLRLSRTLSWVETR